MDRSLPLKRFLLSFWAAWFSIIFASNLCDAAKAAGLLGDSWAFASGNLAFVSQATARYATRAWVNAVLFTGVLVWEARKPWGSRSEAGDVTNM